MGAREAVDHDVVAAGERVRDPRVAAVLEELEDAVGRVHAVVLPPVRHGEAAVVEARVALEEVGARRVLAVDDVEDRLADEHALGPRGRLVADEELRARRRVAVDGVDVAVLVAAAARVDVQPLEELARLLVPVVVRVARRRRARLDEEARLLQVHHRCRCFRVGVAPRRRPARAGHRRRRRSPRQPKTTMVERTQARIRAVHVTTKLSLSRS